MALEKGSFFKQRCLYCSLFSGNLNTRNSKSRIIRILDILVSSNYMAFYYCINCFSSTKINYQQSESFVEEHFNSVCRFQITDLDEVWFKISILFWSSDWLTSRQSHLSFCCQNSQRVKQFAKKYDND